MKTSITLLILIVTFGHISGQSTNLSHIGTSGDWFGWDSSTPFALSIEHRANQHINFSTNNAFRMRLTNNGRLGVGINTTAMLNSTLTLNDFGPATNGLLFRTEGNQLYQNMWQMYTGTTQTSQSEKFRIYSETGASPFIGFRTTSNNGGFRFETSGLNPNGSVTPFERIRVNGMQNMIVNGTSYNADGFIGFCRDNSYWTDPGAVQSPLSMLHLIGTTGTFQQSGYRDWMRDGITFTSNNDLCWIGPRPISNDVTEFVLDWADNSGPGNVGPDDFVVRFTSDNGNGATGETSNEGLEMLRCTAQDGGRVSVGDQFDNTLANRPQRKLHVHDPGLSNTANAQLRLSYTLGASPIATDFRTTSNGNLFILPLGGQGRVGIGIDTPLEKLDVAGNARFQAIPNTNANCVILGKTVTNGMPQDNALRRLDFNLDPTSYLGGDGTWHSMNLGCTWNTATNAGSNDLVMGYTGACNTGKVGIGLNLPIAKLDLNYQTPTNSTLVSTGIHSSTTGGASGTYAVVGEAFATGGIGRGVSGFANDLSGDTKLAGGYFVCNSTLNGQGGFGATGYSTSTVINSGASNVGLRGTAGNSLFGTNVGVIGYCVANVNGPTVLGVSGEVHTTGDIPAGANNVLYGVRGTTHVTNCGYKAVAIEAVTSGNTNCGVTDNLAARFHGEVQADGTIYMSGSPVAISDAQFKTNVHHMERTLDMIMQLKPVTYEMDTNFTEFNFESGKQFGLIAQDVQNIFPELVVEHTSFGLHDSLGKETVHPTTYLGVQYTEFIPILIRGFQQQQEVIQYQSQQIQDQQAQIQSIQDSIFAMQTRSLSYPAENGQQINEQNVTLRDLRNIVLNQNAPNPWAEKTTISYEINQEFNKAQLHFYDANGRLIETLNVTQQGKGQINVFADDLSSGVYSYALIVDGNIIETRSMVKIDR